MRPATPKQVAAYKGTPIYEPTPKQVEFHRSKLPNLLYGGAAGGAKSHALRWDAYKKCLGHPHFSALLLRRTFGELEETHIKAAIREARAFQSEYRKSGKLGSHVVTFPNGSTLKFGHCQNLGDEVQYLSTEYDWVGFDELATFEEVQVVEISARLRSVRPSIVPQLRATSNPGGAYTLWCVDKFIQKTYSGPGYDPAEWGYIPARLYDNPHLMDPDGTFSTYEKRLMHLPPERRRQLLDGDWSAITGQFFPEFSTARHLRSVKIAPYTRIERWIDWGYVQPGYCAWAALLPDGHIHVFKEWPFQGQIAAVVKARIYDETLPYLHAPHLLELGKSVADPSMWSLQGHTGESFAETFGREPKSVALQPGDHDRVLGWGRLRHWLQLAPDGIPWLTFDPDCRYAIRTLPTLISDRARPEDLDTTGPDHAADAVRYGLMARPAPTEFAEEAVYPPDSVGWWLQQEAVVKREARLFGRVN